MKIPKISKEFLTGNLAGIVYKEKTPQPYEIGKIYKDCVTGAKYKVIKQEYIDE